MFSLLNQSCVITSATPRTENHGEDHVTALDVHLKCTLANTVLDEIAPNLRPSLYTNATVSGHNMALDLEADHLPNMRYPAMKKIPWDLEIKDCTATFDIGGNNNNIVFTEATVNKIVFQPKEGGSVELSFKVAGKPNPGELGKLCSMIKDEVDVTLDAPVPVVDPQQDLEGEDDADS